MDAFSGSLVVMCALKFAPLVFVRPGELRKAEWTEGERSGSIHDPDGHCWLIGHSIEDVSAEEMQRRYDKAFE